MTDHYEVSEHMVVAAFRYALGRRTAMVSQVSSEVESLAPRLASWVRQQMIRDIAEAIEAERAGMACDVQDWQRLARVLTELEGS